MNVSILIPQLFYDLIARMVPGAVLAACALVIFEGPVAGPQRLTDWSGNSALVLVGDVLAAHILGTLLGGVWFRFYRLGLPNEPAGVCTHRWWLKWLHGWAKNGERRVDEAFEATFKGEEWPAIGKIRTKEITSTGRMALIYDYVQLRCPRAAARIAKLHAEQHMCGVLMIGCILLAAVYWWFASARYAGWHPRNVVTALLLSALTAGWLAWHLEKRSGTALYFSWYLVWDGVAEEGREPEARAK